ncbi:protein FAR1-RELATED SEQUENCE 5-like [Lotus japonicus]|uniref:protein FAR1-RELATED SEQUENCE 5-like n=1 Tax=Lotus japonicus TaxID=34305 RepID=UPI00258A5CF6|nr:protein FAR1-RELATED SEQUENCE 5-like [Lotus japonicus]
MNAFFDGYINSRASLQQFVRQYDNALKDKAEKEYEADFRSFHTVVPCGSNSYIERQFQQEYTHSKFNEVQAEFRAKMNCYVCSITIDSPICIYEVMEEMHVVGRLKEGVFRVVFNRNDHDIKCTCLLFQFRGIICRHSLQVLAQERVKQVPSRYLLPRWSQNIRRNYAYIKSSYHVKQLQPQTQRFDELCKKFYKIAEIACETIDATALLDNTMRGIQDKVKEKVKEAAANTKGKGHHQGDAARPVQANLGVSLSADQVNIHSPITKPRRGRPPSKRKMSTTEQVIRKKRTKNNQQAIVTDHIVGMASQECESSLHMGHRTDDIDSGGFEQPHSVLTGVNGSRNDGVYLQNCSASELSDGHATSFLSLLEADEGPSYNYLDSQSTVTSHASQFPYFIGVDGHFVTITNVTNE